MVLLLQAMLLYNQLMYIFLGELANTLEPLRWLPVIVHTDIPKRNIDLLECFKMCSIVYFSIEELFHVVLIGPIYILVNYV